MIGQEIQRRLSSYTISDNSGGRKNKFRVNSSEFPHEVWLVHDLHDALKLINKTENILAFRKLRELKSIKGQYAVELEIKELQQYRKELKFK